VLLEIEVDLHWLAIKGQFKKMKNINFELILGPGVQYRLLEGALNGPLAEYD
jgi:hypothetical protein